MNLFLTGNIQIGKSTVLKKALQALTAETNLRLGGFYTFHIPDCRDVFMAEYGAEPIIDDAHRIATWQGNAMLPHEEVFNQLGVKLLTKAEWADWIIMDELGFLEKNATAFQEKVFQCLRGKTPCAGVLRKGIVPWQKPIYQIPDLKIFEVTLENRESLPTEFFHLLRQTHFRSYRGNL